MKYMGRVWAVVLGCTLALAAGCGRSNPLQVHFPEGLERRYEISERQETEMSIPVINEGMRQSLRSESTLRIGVVAPGASGPGTVRVITESTSSQLRMSFMGEDISINTEDGDSPFSKMDEALIGEEFRLTIEPDGHITGVEGFDKIVDKILGSLGAGTFLPGEIGDMMREFWTDDQVRLSMQRSVFARMPVRAVERGSTWTAAYTVTQPVPMSIEETYTVLNVYDDRVTIDVASTISRHPTESSVDFGGAFSMTIDARGDGEGFIEVDRATGWINEASTTLRIRGETEFGGGGMPPGMGKVPMTARVEINARAL